MSGDEPKENSSPRAIRAAAELYDRWDSHQQSGDTPLDRIVSGYFRSHHELNSGERRWISSAVFGTVRLLARQQAILQNMNRAETGEALIELWAEDRGPGAELVRAIAALPQQGEAGYLRTVLSYPEEMALSLEQLLGPEAEAAGEAFNRQASTTLRVNPLRARVGRVRHVLPETTQGCYSPWCLELPRRVNIFELPGYREGWYEIQEEASELAALLCDVQPGVTVVDACAGAGGKSLALAAMLQNSGTVLAIDTFTPRLDELKDRAKRAKASCIETIRIRPGPEGLWEPSERARQTLNRFYSKADCVLVDAPCTGSGAIRRSPDAKWRSVNLEEITALQLTLLQQTAPLVKPGGCLIYVTCTFEAAQNEEVVEQFLAGQLGGQFTVEEGQPRLEAARNRAAEQCMAARMRADWQRAELQNLFDGAYMRTWPHRHGLDAFFGARLVRRQ